MERESSFEAIYLLASRLMDKMDKSSVGSIEMTVGDMSIKLLKALSGEGVKCEPEEPPALPEVTMPISAISLKQEPERPAREPETASRNPGNVVRSPIVGVFYASSAPGADPFVSVGDQVARGDILCIVEAMKMMNEIESEYEGTVAEILIKSGDMVEYGQPLMIIG